MTITRKFKFGTWINVLLLSIGVLIMLYPLAWLISTALKPDVFALDGHFIPTHATLSNFSAILSPNSAAPVPQWLFNSLLVSISASVLVMLIDSLAAFALARLQFYSRKFIFYLVIASLVVPFIALLIPLYNEFSQANLLDTYWALILPYTSNAFGVFLLYQFFRGIPKELEEAAVADGASKFQIWRKIFVPLSIPGTATLGLLTFMNVYNDFFWPLVATTSTPMRTLTVGVAIMTIGNYSTQYSLMMALTLFSVIPMVLAFLFAQKQLVQGIATTGFNA
jgi:multiple sugar transport system permease protein